MRFSIRLFLAAFLAVLTLSGLRSMPAIAANEKPLGEVLQAQQAHVGGANAATGATVYPGDAFDTENGGLLRLRIGASQVYMLSAAAATLSQDSEIAMLTVTRGTIGFSSPIFGQFEVETPGGILRGADGKPAYGEVTVSSTDEMVIGAYGGDLVLDNAGELHTIAGGKSYRVEIQQEPDAGTQNANVSPAVKNRKRRKLVFVLIFAGTVAGLDIWGWQTLSESPSKP